jgi:hypothetical protein
MTQKTVVKRLKQVGDKGLETPQKPSEKTPISKKTGANSGAVATNQSLTDPDLQLILTNWPKLSKPLQQGILAMIRSAINQ